MGYWKGKEHKLLLLFYPVGFEVLLEVSIHSAVFWAVTLYSLVQVSQTVLRGKVASAPRKLLNAEFSFLRAIICDF
jgi:hypothetical protein